MDVGTVKLQDRRLHQVEKRSFGIINGKEVSLYTLRNKKGLAASVTNFGATLVSLLVPDKAGNFADVVLGYDSLDGYLTDKPYLGSTIGRYANRIAHGQFSLNGTKYAVPLND